jgi:hypothetical protein
MLMRVLDGHHDLVVLPREGSFIRNYYFKKLTETTKLEELLGYPELIFSDQDKLNILASKSNAIQSANLRRLDAARFKYEFSKSLHTAHAADILLRMFIALHQALVRSHPNLGKAAQSRYMVVKDPLYAELIFQDLLRINRGAKLIYIRRDAGSRYLSSKVRILSDSNEIPQKLGFDYFTFQFLLTVTSMVVFDHVSKSYPYSVFELNYENFCDNPRAHLLEICDFLQIKYSDILSSLTYFSEVAVYSSSSYGQAHDGIYIMKPDPSIVLSSKFELNALEAGLRFLFSPNPSVNDARLFTSIVKKRFGYDNDESYKKRVNFFDALNFESCNPSTIKEIFLSEILKQPTNLL